MNGRGKPRIRGGQREDVAPETPKASSWSRP